MQQNTEGNSNTGIGIGALELNTQGDANTAIGVFALASTTSDGNTAVGALALQFNQTGVGNNAFGQNALGSNVIGSGNNGFGTGALFGNHGSFNTAMGDFALILNDTGNENVAVGRAALSSNTSGVGNVAIGNFAGAASTTGSNNVYIGAKFGGLAGESDHTYIRNIATTTVNGLVVNVDPTTQLLGHASSSRRYKEQIKPMDKASHALYRLKPVTFRYKKEIDRTRSDAFGLIAEEVAEVNPALVANNSQGQPESVRYEMVNAMLLNEFLKEHRKVAEQERKLAKQEATIAKLQDQIEALATGLQKADAQSPLSKSALRTVLNNQ
jgi:Chaperone of endosialidase